MKIFICCLALMWTHVRSVNAQNRYDVVITEILADPSPQVGLPQSEWIEIKNSSSSALNLQGWRLGDANNQSGPFPSFLLQPDSIVIICSNSALPGLLNYGPAISVSSFPSLDNDGDILVIRSAGNKIIHSVSYDLSWYKNELKKQGGWSLEMIDPQNPCAGKYNWQASTHVSGGTPGKRNSVDGVNADLLAPELLHSYTVDSITIRLVFDEPVDSLSGATLLNYSMNSGAALISAVTVPPLFDEVELRSSSVLTEGLIYYINVSSVKDCRGNPMPGTGVKTGIPSFPGRQDWIINEILFDPHPNGYDYVEFLNNSDKIFDLSDLLVANRNSSGIISSMQYISNRPRLVFPGEYIVVTEAADNLVLQYFVQSPGQVKMINSLPSFPDDEGIVIALDSRGIITDELKYEKEWHFKLISDPEGVALERIDPGGNSQDKMNWHSASSNAGYGTPGYKNSQYFPIAEQASHFQIEPLIFSPDNDGRDDYLVIQYETEAPGYMVNVLIFDAVGREVRHLVRNELAGKKGHWKWDGIDSKGMKLPAAIYVVYAEFFNLAGKKQIFKKAVSIAMP